ncbi:hypothetical protein LtaPh_2307000 [Leishmania tarentolae]|uniref:Uncharacterized protein n=1 Tax=Leishmania tarentolae TaxID=5689 RepID=A0A640KG73_LEITA|nr:hypothetical protein LtaPh_2307000 [Leishmania tarentolae]
MNVLHSIVKVTFGPVTADEEDPAESPSMPSEVMKVVPRQLLTFRLIVTYDNVEKDVSKEEAAKTFLSMVGIHSLEAAWSQLFSAVHVVPFLLCKSDSSTRPQSERVSSQVPVSSPPVPPPALEEWTRWASSAFVCGTPRFWSSRCYRWSLSDAAAKKSDTPPLHGPTMTELSMPTSLSLLTAVPSLPMATATASPSFGNNSHGASVGNSDAYGDSSAGVRCEAIGNVLRVVADEGSPRRLPTEATVACEGVAAGFTRVGLPDLLESRFTIELGLPDFEVASLQGVETALAMVILLPLCAAGGGGTATASAEAGGQPLILRSVLARSVGQTLAEAAAASALVLGSGVVPVELINPFLCVSSTSPLSNDRLVLNLSLTNVTASVARLYSTSFDLHSSCVLPDTSITGGDVAGEEQGTLHITANSLWGEMRPGANLSSMRTIDLLEKLVTITPVVVGEERPPVELYPGETYTFEFVIEVLPQLCYLLNSQSLEYLYERHYVVPHSAVGGRGSDGSANGKRDEDLPRGGRGCRSSAAATFGHGSVVTDCYDETVSADELRGILSHAYVTHLFVYYDLAAADTAGNGSSARRPLRAPGLAHHTGLCLRYPARWSFGA